MIELACSIEALKDCSYGVCWFAITITTVRKGERTFPAKYLDGADASDREGEDVDEGWSHPLTHIVWGKSEEPAYKEKEPASGLRT